MTAPAAIQRFRVLEEISSGAMGTVYRAHDPQLDRVVAIKVLNAAPAVVRDELSTIHTVDLRNRSDASGEELLQEARIMARLAHPNVVPVFEVGLDEAAVFVVMEHVDGVDLRAWLEGARTTRQILDAFAQAARGLEAAHACGIVHRDFKPANVLIGRDERVRVADFGLSRLSAPESLRVVVDAAGTPRYMAPEQWLGALATARSDVFAFCVALVEALGVEPGDERAATERALRKRDVPKRVRELALRGLDERPEARPEIRELAAALAGRYLSRRTLAVGAALAIALAGAGVAAAVTKEDPEEACAVEPSVLEPHWNASVRDGLRARLIDRADPKVASAAARVLADVDAHAAAIETAARDACSAAARGELAATEAAQRRSCLERRAIELGALARYVTAAPKLDAATADDKLWPIAQYSSAVPCGEFAVPRGDAGDLAELYARYSAARDLPDKERVVESAAIESAARALGDTELEVRAALTHAGALDDADRLAESPSVKERAHASATAIKHPSLIALALLERARSVELQMDITTAKSLAKLSLEYAMHPTVAPRARAFVYRGLGRAASVRGEFVEAIATVRKGLEIVQGHPMMRELELLLMTQLADSTILSSGPRQADAAVLIRGARELARAYSGEHTIEYATLLEMEGKSLSFENKVEQALALRQQALAILRELLPADHSRVITMRGTVAGALRLTNRFAEARRELEFALDAAARSPALKRERGFWLCSLAQVTFELGEHARALALGERCVEQMSADRGATQTDTLFARRQHLGHLIETGHLSEAERRLPALIEAYQQRTEPFERIRLIRLRGNFAADIALGRGRPQVAEALSRKAIAELSELDAPEINMYGSKLLLGISLVAQRRFALAIPILEEASAMARREREREDYIALSELEIAYAREGLGQRAKAAAEARRLVELFARWPGQPLARKRAERLLAMTGGARASQVKRAQSVPLSPFESRSPKP